MQPTERPRNDNWNPADGDPPEPGLFSTRKRAIESTFALAVIAVWAVCAWLYLGPKGWLSLGIGVAVVIVVAFARAAYRLIVHGRV